VERIFGRAGTAAIIVRPAARKARLKNRRKSKGQIFVTGFPLILFLKMLPGDRKNLWTRLHPPNRRLMIYLNENLFN